VKHLFETALISLVKSYGQLGLTLVMIVQTLIAPIPSEALIVFAGAVMNLYDVLVFGGLGLIIGSAIAFLIARRGGRPLVVKIIGEKWTRLMDGWVSRNGTKAILLTRLVPVIPFDLVSYVSGITPMKFSNYLIATIIGAIPRTLFLAYVGSLLGGAFIALGGTLEIIFAVGIVGIMALAYLDSKGYMGQLENTILGKLVKRIWGK
jgi:uncharacterized membrane protein YdjX (TVP38/TMEM64 family)